MSSGQKEKTDMDISLKHLQMLKRAVERHILDLKYPRRKYMTEQDPGTLAEYEKLQEMIEQLILKQ